jgi:hypothetical protein
LEGVRLTPQGADGRPIASASTLELPVHLHEHQHQCGLSPGAAAHPAKVSGPPTIAPLARFVGSFVAANHEMQCPHMPNKENMDTSSNYFTDCTKKFLELRHMGNRAHPLPSKLLKHASLFFSTFTIPVTYRFLPNWGN